MTLYESLYPLEVFTTTEAIERTGFDPHRLHRRLSDLRRDGRLVKIRRGLWAVVPFEGPIPPDRHLIGSRLSSPYAFSYHTALELHGIAHTPSDQIQVGSPLSFKAFIHDGVEYRSYRLNQYIIDDCTVTRQISGHDIIYTDREATFVLCVSNPRWSGGVEEILNSLGAFPTLDTERVMELVKRIGKVSAFNAVGLVLEIFRDRWDPQPNLLWQFREQAREKSPVYWGTSPGSKNQLVRRYNIIVPSSVEIPFGY